MKVYIYIFALIIFSVTLLQVESAYSKRFNKDGYSIDIVAKEKMSKVKIWGNINGGKKCNQLNIDVYLQNSTTGDRLNFNTYIDEYLPKSRNKFNTKYKKVWHEKKFHTKKGKHSWYVDSYYIKCLE